MLRNIVNLKKHHQLLFSLIVLVGMVFLWRGMWGILDMFFLPGHPLLSYPLSALVGIGIITVTHYFIDKIV